MSLAGAAAFKPRCPTGECRPDLATYDGMFAYKCEVCGQRVDQRMIVAARMRGPGVTQEMLRDARAAADRWAAARKPLPHCGNPDCDGTCLDPECIPPDHAGPPRPLVVYSARPWLASVRRSVPWAGLALVLWLVDAPAVFWGGSLIWAGAQLVTAAIVRLLEPPRG